MTHYTHDTLMGTSNMFKLKVVLIGDISVGKTSLALRFTSNTFRDGYQATIGATFISKTTVVDDDVICYQIWDTAGQERYKSLVPMYLRGAHIALVVYDVTDPESFANLGWWLECLKEHGGVLRAAVVANKCDLVDEVGDLSPVKLAQEHGLQFVTVSAKTGEHVEELFHRMGVKAVEDIKRLNQKPSKFDTIKLTESTESCGEKDEKRGRKKCCKS
ncbi:VPS21-like protein [Mya arenaria]|uniref:VPS21-like protein n=1 Tax=Mya arenaria TaxID=6604 RepID=A0ABY7DQC1_MYAAR|nr:uncharacterized protein LOC128226962 [Mya arenaria]XP_052795479.1 uncharacterized protein LOC128228291 [Mya arenaria]WAQ99609.1 VPS21-like protein [Mya arenaria]WAQ99812.1 VPS21-like protein [Mya arenaria]